MKNLVILLFINTSYILAMEKTHEDTYTIITLDNSENKIPQKHLLLSKVISDMVQDVSNNTAPLPLPINSETLPLLKNCLENSYIFQDKTASNDAREIAKNELEKQLGIQPNLHTIITFAQRMIIPHLLEECVQMWANKEYIPSAKFPLSFDLNIHIAKYMKGSKQLLDKTKKWVMRDFIQKRKHLLEKNISIKNGSGLWSTAISNNGNYIAAGTNSGIILTYNLKTDNFHFIESEHPGCTALQFNEDDSQIWSSGEDGKIKAWNLSTRKLSHTFQSPLCKAFVFRYIPNYNVLITDSETGKLCIWNIPCNSDPKLINAHSDYITTLEASVDGSLFVSTSYDGSVQIRDTETKKLKAIFTHDNTNVMSINFNYGKNRLICGSDDGSITLYDLTTEKKLLDKEKHADGIWSVLFSDTCDTLFCSGSKDCTIKLWDTRTYRPIITLHDHYDCIQSMAVDFEQQRLVSASSDKTVKVWDLCKLVTPIKTIRNEILDKCTIEHILNFANTTKKSLDDPLLVNFSENTKKFLTDTAYRTK